MGKAWEWLKKNWKWVLFPIGILMAVGGYFFWKKRQDPPVDTTTDDDANKAVDEVIDAAATKDEAVKELERVHNGRIAKMSEDQKKEYEAIKDRPIEEIASWLDKL